MSHREDAEPRSRPITRLLTAWTRGEPAAADDLVRLIYPELRRMAGKALRRERTGHTLQPTALVNELYLRLIEQRQASWESRAHFFAVAAEIMRRVLVDHARARLADKRGGGSLHVTLSDATEVGIVPALDVLALDQALAELAELDLTQARVVELRFFAGLTVEETAHVLGRSPRTIKREWRFAKAWLHRALSASI